MRPQILELVRHAFGDQYQVDREVGRGSGARVFLAVDRAGQKVALKILHPEFLESVAADRFLREIRLVSQLNHPHIARLLDSGEREWLVYIAMAFIDGPRVALKLLDQASFWTRTDVQPTGDSPFYVHEYERFIRAELLNALGRSTEALTSYVQMADNLFHLGPPAHLRLAQIYDHLGDRRKAVDHYARFIALWKDCDPQLRPMVVEAQQRVDDIH